MLAAFFANPLSRLIAVVTISLAVGFGSGAVTAYKWIKANQADEIIAAAKQADDLRRKWESDAIKAVARSNAYEASLTSATQTILEKVKIYETPAGCSDLGPVWGRLHDRAAMGLPHAAYAPR
ncbi:MAG: hypothetical protein HZB29_07370 [Nitrospinae bacterium]|nr:hypothetical protein [Nitrospinota bacterium]